ncbi:MAG: hypothetical protein Q9O24_04270 [Gammaproteobacteria bacterium]|nr:hypothetical protein [Gammaproteobacteria bacterium]
MIKAPAFIRTDTLILLALAISLTAFVYFSSNDNSNPIATNERNRITENADISPVGKLVVTHNPADASAVLQQLASLNAINTTSSKQTHIEPETDNSIDNALTSAVANADSTTTETKPTAVPTSPEKTGAATPQEVALAPVNRVKHRAAQPHPASYRRYYNMPFPMPVYQLPPPTNPYRHQYGHAPYPTSR